MDLPPEFAELKDEYDALHEKTVLAENDPALRKILIAEAQQWRAKAQMWEISKLFKGGPVGGDRVWGKLRKVLGKSGTESFAKANTAAHKWLQAAYDRIENLEAEGHE